MLLLVALSLATSALALLIARAEITAWLRDSLPKRVKAGVSCTYCVSFWVAVALSAVYGPLPGLPAWLSVVAVWGGAAVAVRLSDW